MVEVRPEKSLPMAYRAHTSFAPLRALRAARTLVKDPDDLPQVFTIIESLSFDTLQRIDRMAKDAAGRAMFDTRPDIVEQLADRAALGPASRGKAPVAPISRSSIARSP